MAGTAPGSGQSAELTAMAQSARYVDEAGQTLAAIRGRVQQAVAATSGGYVSEAATLFRTVMNSWNDDFNKIVAGLDQIHVALTRTHANYTASVQQDRASVNQVAALLNGGAANVIK
jgi:WXG100 family type VII secretion target